MPLLLAFTEYCCPFSFIEPVAHAVTACIHGNDPETVAVRRRILRYLCLVQVLVFQDISLRVRKRFPNLDALVNAGWFISAEGYLENIILV